MNDILQLFGRMVCRFRPHQWKRDRDLDIKTCRRCGLVNSIKRRVK